MARLQDQTSVHLRELAAQLRESAIETHQLAYQAMLRHAAEDLESEAERRDDQLRRMR